MIRITPHLIFICMVLSVSFGQNTFTFIPSFTNIHTTTLEVFLTLDEAVTSSGDVSGVCQTVMVKTLEEAKYLYNNPNCTTFSTVPPITGTSTASPINNLTTTITPDVTSPWIIDENIFQFERDEYYKSVVSRRQLAVIDVVVEYVVVTCCTRPPSISKYEDLSSAMIAEVRLTPNICNNCTGGVITGVLTEERSITNPAFVEVAPCSCDKTYKACDIQCCCDNDCTADMKQTFTICIPGLAGGLSAPVPDRSCASQNPFKDDYFPAMCVIFEQNSYLGLYHTNQAKVSTDLEFTARAGSKKNFYQLSKSKKRFNDPDAALKGYIYGANVRTNRAGVALPEKGTLALPQQSAGGDCVRNAPVQFLKDFQTDCISPALQELCVINSVFSARVYAEPSSIFQLPLLSGFEISEKYGGDVLVPSNVSYYCADNTYIQNYLKSATTFDDLIQPNVAWLFNSTFDSENCENPCQNLNCILYNSDRQNEAIPLPSRCVWDDGNTQALIPQVQGGSCENSVVDVRYRFTWSGQKIVNLVADVIMGTIPIAADVSQSYQVVFNQQINSSSVNATRLDRSGHPGYDMGKMIHTGCYNITNAITDIDNTKQMAVWNTGVDGLCYNAKRTGLLFGEDMMSSCSLRLGLNEINNCDNLKTIVLNHLNTLMPSNVLGRQGYNDPSNETLWVQVLRQNVTELLNNTAVSDNNTLSSPIDDLKGICQDITSGIHLHILYGETGKGNGYPIYEILGGRVSYTIDDWQLSCSGSNAVKCRENSKDVETFLLTSTVQYIAVPAQKPVKSIKFWAIHNDPTCQTDSCQRYFENFDRTTCHYDTCWHELFYPLSASYTADSQMYVLAFTLVTCIFIFAYYMIGQRHKLAYGISKDNSLGNIINTFPTECCT